MRKQNVRRGMFFEICVQRSAIDGVAARCIAAVGPVEGPIFQIELEIDWLGQTIEQSFDIGPVRGSLTARDVDLSAKDSALSRISGAFLRPINLSAVRIDSDPDAHLSFVRSRSRVAVATVDQSFDVRTIQVRAHHTHSFAVAPIEFAALLFEMELLRRECPAFANDGYA